MNRDDPKKGKFYLARKNYRLDKIKDLLQKYLKLDIEANPLDDHEPIPIGRLLKIFVITELQDLNKKNIPTNSKNIPTAIKKAFDSRDITNFVFLIPNYFSIVFLDFILKFRAIILLLQSTTFQRILLIYISSNLDETRLAIRKQLPQLNVFGILGLIPFIFGISYFLRNKYGEISTTILFRETLPLFARPIDTVSWETFEYNAKYDIDNSEAIWYDDMIITKRIPHEPHVIIQNDNQSFILKSNTKRYSFHNKILTNMDQLPLKLESFQLLTETLNQDSIHFGKVISPSSIVSLKQHDFYENINLNKKYRDLKDSFQHHSKQKQKKLSFKSRLQSFYEQEKFLNNLHFKNWLTSSNLFSILPNWGDDVRQQLPILLQNQLQTAFENEILTLKDLQRAKESFLSLVEKTILRDREEGKFELLKEEEQTQYIQKMQELWGMIDEMPGTNTNSSDDEIVEYSQPESEKSDIETENWSENDTSLTTSNKERTNSLEPKQIKITSEKGEIVRLVDYATTLSSLEIKPDELVKQVQSLNKSIQESKRTIQFLNSLLLKIKESLSTIHDTTLYFDDPIFAQLYQQFNDSEVDISDNLELQFKIYSYLSLQHRKSNKKTQEKTTSDFCWEKSPVFENWNITVPKDSYKKSQTTSIYNSLLADYYEKIIIPTREMSGYNLPDQYQPVLDLNKVFELSLNRDKSKYFQIRLPINFANVRSVNTQSLKLLPNPQPKLPLSKKIFTNKVNEKKLPIATVVFNPTQNYDIDIVSNQKRKQQSIYDWLWKYVSPYNPFAIQQSHYIADQWTWRVNPRDKQTWPTSLFIQQAMRSGKRELEQHEIEHFEKEQQKKKKEKSNRQNNNSGKNLTQSENDIPAVSFLPTADFFSLPKIGPVDTFLREHNSFLPWETDVYITSFSKNTWVQQVKEFEVLLQKIKKNQAKKQPTNFEKWENWDTQLKILTGTIDENLAKKIDAFKAKEESSSKKKKNKKKSKQKPRKKKEKHYLDPLSYQLVKQSTDTSNITLLPLITSKRPIIQDISFEFDSKSNLEYHFSAPISTPTELISHYEVTGTPYENIIGTQTQTYQRIGAPSTPYLSTLNPIERFLNSSFIENSPFLKLTHNYFFKKVLSQLKLTESNLFGPAHWEGFIGNWTETKNLLLSFSGLGLTYLIFLAGQDSLLMYAKETLYYIMVLAVQWGLATPYLKQQISFLSGEKDFVSFRILPSMNKSWSDIAGARVLTPELVEMVITLRMMGQFKIQRLWRTFPTGFLFHGPPGTGKTLLVQILASEANVPVVSISAESILQDYTQGDTRLETAFEEANRLAPCLLFIDEIDGVGERRPEIAKPENQNWWLNTFWEEESFDTIGDEPISYNAAEPPKIRPESGGYMPYYAKRTQQLRKLVILLVELDDITKYRSTRGIVVIGATNRIDVLDPALRRPGRLENTVFFDLPNAQKRGELLQLYSKGVDFDSTILESPKLWKYILDRTETFTPADLAMVMKESAIKSILLQTKHTIHTIEHGIDRLILEPSVKQKPVERDTLSRLQLAYHQAGKIVLSKLLPNVTPVLIAHLWPRELNSRGKAIEALREKKALNTFIPQSLTNRLITSYAGIAAEHLFFQSNHSKNISAKFSTLGLDDILFGNFLSELLVKSKFSYSTDFETLDWVTVSANWNSQEFTKNKFLLKRRRIEAIADDKQSLDFEFKQFLDPDLTREIEYKFDESEEPNQQLQERTQDIGWWYQHFKIMYQDHDLGFDPSGRFARKIWFRDEWNSVFYSDQTTWKRNLDFIKPELILQTHKFDFNLTTTRVKLSEISAIQIDYQRHSVILNAFNKAFSLLESNRELLDILVYQLIKKKTLRAPEIDDIVLRFIKKISADLTIIKSEKQTQPIRIISKTWGANSRKPYIRWININEIKKI